MTSPLTRLMDNVRPGRYVSLTRSTFPINTPLLTVAKEHVKSETTVDDTLLQRLIDAAVSYVEKVSRKSLFDQSFTLVLDSFPDDGYIQLYAQPVKTVTTFTIHDEYDVPDTTFDKYTVDALGTRILLNYGYSWPVDLRSRSAVQVVYVAGHGTTVAALPPALVQAVMLLVSHWYANREAGGCDVSPEMAYSIAAILGIERVLRL